MKTIRNFVIAAICILSTFAASAQSADKGVYLSVSLDKESVANLPEQSYSYLLNKMKQIVSQNGVAADGELSQFTLECNVAVTDKNITGGAPAKISERVEFSFYVKDIVGKKSFGNITVFSKGVGDNENKAMISAIKNISAVNKDLKSFLSETCNSIVDYYNANADVIIKEAKLLSKAKKYDEALFLLCVIPQSSGDKYIEALNVAEQIYKDFVNNSANENLAKAQSLWAAGRNQKAAEKAAEYLGAITSEADCYKQAQTLMKDMAAVMDKDKEYKQQMEAQEKAREHEATMSSVEAMKQIALSYQAKEMQRGRIVL